MQFPSLLLLVVSISWLTIPSSSVCAAYNGLAFAWYPLHRWCGCDCGHAQCQEHHLNLMLCEARLIFTIVIG